MSIKKVKALENSFEGLTKGKEYDLLEVDHSEPLLYTVCTDLGSIISFYAWRFEPSLMINRIESIICEYQKQLEELKGLK